MARALAVLPTVTEAGGDSRRSDGYISRAIDVNDFDTYQISIIHDWLQTITALAFILVPIFFVLDIFITPPELLPRFAVYRGISTVVALVQHLIVRRSQPSKHSFLHGYVMSLQVGGVIALMTVHLGGFESGYYAGLILVIIGVNLLMPWRAEHTAANTAIILGMYVSLNLVAHQQYDTRAFANNLFFLCGTAIISVAINHVRYRLIQSEFSLLVQLKHARDALWSEMELAKQIQMALLPRHLELSGYEVAVTMVPAAEVGGDYYEVMETANGDRYVAIGDVAGHGLDSGLIMMMAQTSVMTVVRSGRSREPAEVLKAVNAVLRENVGRLGSNHYMTMSVLKLDDHGMTVSGHHQDILIYRKEQSALEVVPTEGTWLGISDDITDFLPTTHVPLDEGDAVLLFTDGLTEAQTESGELYGMERLRRSFREVACEPVADGVSRIITDARSYQHNQTDDATVILIKKVAASRYAGADQEIHGGRT